MTKQRAELVALEQRLGDAQAQLVEAQRLRAEVEADLAVEAETRDEQLRAEWAAQLPGLEQKFAEVAIPVLADLAAIRSRLGWAGGPPRPDVLWLLQHKLLDSLADAVEARLRPGQ